MIKIANNKIWDLRIGRQIESFDHIGRLLPKIACKKRCLFGLYRHQSIPYVQHQLCTMNVLKKVMTWISISFSLWLILITPALVGGSRVYSSSKVAAVTARGAVPPSASSSCTHIGVGNEDHRRCPPSTPSWCPYGLLLYEIIYFLVWIRRIALWIRSYLFYTLNKKPDYDDHVVTLDFLFLRINWLRGRNNFYIYEFNIYFFCLKCNLLFLIILGI